jgi:molybdopterin/thiamine biosynthesis adenylyltransferase
MSPVGRYDGFIVDLTRDELVRFSRHLTLNEFGVEGQKRLKAGRVLCVGAGGLGSPAALYLAAAGVGTIGLVDFDEVDVTNLQRQVLYTTHDVGRSKLEVASERLRALNPFLEIEPHPVRLAASNALELISAYDVILDGTDNFATRYLINDACVLLDKPNVHGSIFRFEGQATTFIPHEGPCYRCLFPTPPPPELAPSCAEAGVLGLLPGTVGIIQATETAKLILGIGEPLMGRLLTYDALEMEFRELRLSRDPECPMCGPGAPTSLDDIEYTDVGCLIPALAVH